MDNLTAQQKAFIAEYIVCLNPCEAAIKAGYKKSHAKQTGDALLKRDYIIEGIKNLLSEQVSALKVSRGYIVQKLLEILEFSVEREEIMDKEGMPTGKTKLRDTQSSLRALDFLCKHLGTESGVAHPGDDNAPRLTIIDNLNQHKI